MTKSILSHSDTQTEFVTPEFRLQWVEQYNRGEEMDPRFIAWYVFKKLNGIKKEGMGQGIKGRLGGLEQFVG